MRRSAKVDENQTAIVEGLRRMGAKVFLVHQVKNLFDIIVFYRCEIFVMEIKNPDSLPKVYDRKRLERELTEGERKCMQDVEWTGNEYHIVTTLEQAIQIITDENRTR